MVALGLIPFLHLVLSLAPLVLWLTGKLAAHGLWLVPIALYLLPPLVVRVVMLIKPPREGRIAVTDAGFLVWWFTAQWQVLFVRLPSTEELLRLIPGAYSMWLRLWGARIGSLVYWAPGVTVLDRPFLDVGRRVVFGMGVRVNPHVIAPLPDGGVGLHLATIEIGDDALIGGYSLLLPGSSVPAGTVTRPFRTVRPLDSTPNSQPPTPKT
jgi:hypothetical protein